MQKITFLYQLYFKMVDRWQEVVCQPVPRAAKQDACLVLLVNLIDQVAEARVGQVNAPLRFFADMALLKSYLVPHSAHDELGHIAIRPSFHLVSDWLLDNAYANRTKPAKDPINITRYMAWQQLRATMIGEQPEYAALDPNGLHSEYVQAVLGRVVGPS